MAAARSRQGTRQAVLGGLGAALIVLSLPGGLIETIVASSGVSEAWPAAAPPLGLKARLLLALFGALMGMGFVCCSSVSGAAPEKEDGRRKAVPGVSRMGFALPKLNWLSRSRATGPSRVSRPVARRADAHPDAPARSPIFASRDFGGLEIFPRIAPARGQDIEREADASVDSGPAAPLAEQQVPAAQEPVEPECEDIIAADPVAGPSSDDPVAHSGPVSGGVSIAELTERLERGLAQRVRGARRDRAEGVIADMPVERAVPVRDQVEDDVDQALRAALSTLRAMAEHTR